MDVKWQAVLSDGQALLEEGYSTAQSGKKGKGVGLTWN